MDYTDITVDAFKEMAGSLHESEYVLIDVRQPDEYRNGHIPGASLIPLSELSERTSEIPADRKVVFYCRSGKRSRSAALLYSSAPQSKAAKVYNLLGGIMAWQGMTIASIPDLKAFDVTAGPGEALVQAMELERGAEQLYLAMLKQYEGSPIEPVLAKLAEAEQAHARKLYRYLEQLALPDRLFDEFYESLSTDILEGGYSVERVIQYLDAETGNSCRTAVEVALTIEYGAYEMYRLLARQFAGQPLEPVFEEIAQGEKGHLNIASQAIGLCTD